jgi:5-methylcytosine-specific restriction protein A
MRKEALFINGVYDSVLQEILDVQAFLPEQILYLQPYSSQRIVRLAENPPTVEDPVRLFASVTDDLATVHYTGEIAGWDDKRTLGDAKLEVLNRVISHLQPGEGEVYVEVGGKKCVNLLYVRRLRKLSRPFPVDQLINVNAGWALSTKRATSGGWVYVINPSEDWLSAHL